jgi:RES domain-containing protein
VILEAWRLVKTRHLAHAFDGEGARLFGGRWNAPGVRVVYLAESLALAALEVLVHMQDAQPLRAYSAIPVHFDAKLVKALRPAELPRGWRATPAPAALREVGDAWIRAGRHAVLEVPSAIVESERIFLVNPEHAAFKRMRIGKPQGFVFDARLGSRKA